MFKGDKYGPHFGVPPAEGELVEVVKGPDVIGLGKVTQSVLVCDHSTDPGTVTTRVTVLPAELV